MNERIKELMFDAGLNSNYVEGFDSIYLKQLEKFAQLIIRECMDLLEDYTTDVHVGGIQYNVLSAEETLQKHFGLE